jgi:hypothetical protein
MLHFIVLLIIHQLLITSIVSSHYWLTSNLKNFQISEIEIYGSNSLSYSLSFQSPPEADGTIILTQEIKAVAGATAGNQFKKSKREEEI